MPFISLSFLDVYGSSQSAFFALVLLMAAAKTAWLQSSTKWIVYIGEVCFQNCQGHTTVTTVLALATLGGMTQIGYFLFAWCRPRWPRQIQ
jgi:hypothetical protein